jgi:alkanesulfonate monooxygenase SsuD/methylene tetrahydromethanopterin reductase-like flavin-dependent oxidoreductase (luciferase family)
MLSRETLENYRRMTPGERLRLTLELQQASEKYLLVGTPDQVRRKFELLERENNARNIGMLTAIAASKRRRGE